MAGNLISCDNVPDLIYIHSGITSTILDSFASPSVIPLGLTYDGTNLISCGLISIYKKIWIHSGITSTILDSFASPSANPSGLAYDGTNLISCDEAETMIYIHSGITSTITDSYKAEVDSKGGLSGLTFAEGNLIHCSSGSNKIYIHSGITSTITDSFASPHTRIKGLAYDGTNLISCDTSSDLIYIHSGITSTILDSFASPNGFPSGLTVSPSVVVITTLTPTLVEDGIANLRLELEDKAGVTIHPVGWYCDENAAPSTEYIEIGWRAGIGGIDLALGIYSKYVKTLPTGYPTLYVQAWADDSNDNRYTGSILSFDIPTEAEYLEFPDIIFPEFPELELLKLEPWNINLPSLPPWIYWDFSELPPLPPWILPKLSSWEMPDYPSLSFINDLYYKEPYTRKDLEELRQKCINYEKNYTDFCLILNHNTLLVKNFLQSAYNNGVLGGENEMFAKIYPSQQLTPLYLESLELNDFKGIINRFINNNTSNSMGLNHNFDLFKEWLNDYNYTSDGYKASYITPKEEIITNNEPTVKYLTGKINRLQREVSTASREIMHNFNLMKEIIQ